MHLRAAHCIIIEFAVDDTRTWQWVEKELNGCQVVSAQSAGTAMT
jgi:hypothetical protein